MNVLEGLKRYLASKFKSPEERDLESSKAGWFHRGRGQPRISPDLEPRKRAARVALHAWLSRFPDFSTMTRQRRRRVALAKAFAEVNEKYGPEPRKNRRRMALALMRRRR
jgi:hypothetical protein